METFGYEPSDPGSYVLLAVPTMLAKSSVCIDPIIYFGLNPQFKAEITKVLHKIAKVISCKK